MAQRGRPRKDITTRDPAFTVRDPVIMPNTQEEATEATPAQRKPRRYIPASMPVVCPECGHNTRVDGNRYIDPAHRRIVEYRSCIRCGCKVGAGRDMTKTEIERHCTHEDAVRDYQSQM